MEQVLISAEAVIRRNQASTQTRGGAIKGNLRQLRAAYCDHYIEENIFLQSFLPVRRLSAKQLCESGVKEYLISACFIS